MNNVSFSAYTKNELSKINNLNKKQEVLVELIGYLVTPNYSKRKKSSKYSTENEYNINRFAKLLNNMNISNYQISLQGKNYVITIKNKEDLINIEQQLKDIKQENLKKAYIRGAFLGSGYINNPENDYHLEVIFKNIDFAKRAIDFLNDYSIKANILHKPKTISIYIKDSDEISKFLAFIGANSAVLRFEEIRVIRDMKNNVNRLVNCETANLNKTISASVEQIDIIKKLRKTRKFDKLPNDLKEIAILREKNPEATLEELGKMLEKPIGKSSVSNRFKRLKENL